MKKLLSFICLILLSTKIYSQSCSILAKANNMTPDKLCSPVTALWNVSYTGVNDGGTAVQINYDWDDGTIQTVPAVNVGPGIYQATLTHIYTSLGNVCDYHPSATLVVNGVLCTSSSQEQIVTVWDDDNHNGGHMHINPAVYPICIGNGDNVRFQDLTQFNCVPPQEEDVPNLFTRWVQWIYGTDITMTGTPVTINGTPRVFPYSAPVITLPGPVTGSGVFSDVINVANDKLLGQYFQVTLRNWNYCNPYDDPDIPGPPADPVNGDHPPVTTTAIILIVPYPDATINPVGNFCLHDPQVTLTAHDPGGTWAGAGVTGNIFDPALAGVGNHTITYTITTASGCTDNDQITIGVFPVPDATITPVGNLCSNDPVIILTANDSGGTWSGAGVLGNTFNPAAAGIGDHIITYNITDINGCSSSDQITITVGSSPDATITPVGNMCVNSPQITLNAHDQGGTWIGPGVTGNTFDPAIAGVGSHIIRYSIANANCSDSDQINIVVMAKPDATIDPVNNLCINNSKVNLVAHDQGGTWSGQGVLGALFDPALAGTGTHLITYAITNASGCSDTDQISVTVLPKPDATITPVDTLCVNNPPVTLVAKDPGGVWSGAVSVNIFDPAAAGVGNHTVIYRITDIDGCSDTDQISISVVPVPVVTINRVESLFINSPSVLINATPAGGIFSGDGMTGSIFKPSAAGLGTHVIQYQTIPDRFGCMGTDTIHIDVIMPTLPVAIFGPDTLGCSPLKVQFVNNSVNGESYLWDFGDNVYSVDKDPSHIYYIPGNYIVSLTVTNISGQSVETLIIAVHQNPTAVFDVYPTEVTNNSQIVICTNFSYYAVSQLWEFGDGTTSTEENPWHKFKSEGTYNITLIVTSNDGCVDSSTFPTPVHVRFDVGKISFPNAFVWNRTGPNGGYWQEGTIDDEIFRPHFENVIEYNLKIFNRWGVLIYESNDLQKGWDGYFGNGNLALEGVYVWRATGRFADGKYFDKVGNVTFLH
jgi:PKD domain/CHU_C Type IX secretion signal domain